MTDRADPSTSFAPDAAVTGGFPLTRYSVVLATGSADARLREEAWDALARAYWKPVYKYVRIVWRAAEDDAADLTQAFFTRALEADFFAGYDPAKARFRTYLRVVLQRWLANEHKAAGRLKRGGGVHFVPFDFPSAEGELSERIADPANDPDAFFRQETIRSLFGLAVQDLRRLCDATGKQTHYRVFERYDLHASAADRPTYQELADELALPVTQVTNFLSWTRRELRRLVLEHLRSMTGTDAEFRAEAIELFGTTP